LYPIQQLHPDAENKSKLIWCAKDRVTAWEDWILRDQLPSAAGKCNVPLEKIGKLAKDLGITSTPTLIFADGKRMLGAQPYKEIERMLSAISKK
jgi:thiol:disulfide interchange protein DsbC